MSADNRFDVFLSYNSRDHVPVEVVARWLRDQELKLFQALGTCRAAAAVFVGSREMGDWQQREQYVALIVLLGDGTKRFRELRRMVAGISQRMLASRARGAKLSRKVRL